MNFLKLLKKQQDDSAAIPKKQRFWGANEDGTPYVTGMTVSELKKQLEKFKESDEICITVCPKKYWNGGGFTGKLKALENGSDGQVWLKALVIDPSMELTYEPI